jgi:hypothetical protein
MEVAGVVTSALPYKYGHLLSYTKKLKRTSQAACTFYALDVVGMDFRPFTLYCNDMR